MSSRNYSDTVPQTTLQGNQTGAGGVTSGDTQFVLGTSLAAYITSFPFALRIEPGTANEELVLVTSGAGTIGSPYVVTRGWGNGVSASTLPAVSHAQGSVVTHGVGAADFQAVRDHIDSLASVHGVSSTMKVASGGQGKTSTTTVNATVTETVLHTYTVAANEPVAGSVYRIVVFGTCDNSATGSTITFRLRWGGAAGVQICSFVITTPASLQTNKPWNVEADIVLITVGASGTARGKLRVDSQTPTAAILGPVDAPVSVISSVPTNAQKDLVITAQWGANTAGNILRADSGYSGKIY